MERGLTRLTHKNKAKKEKRCAFELTLYKLQKFKNALVHVLHVEQCRIIEKHVVCCLFLQLYSTFIYVVVPSKVAGSLEHERLTLTRFYESFNLFPRAKS